MLDDRRNFLTAISGCVGALCFWRPKKRIGPPRPRPEPKPRNPRWEWIQYDWQSRWIGIPTKMQWRIHERTWAANVTLFADEWRSIYERLQRCNSEPFMGVSPGCLRIDGIFCGSPRDGLVDCTVILLESNQRMDAVCEIDVDGFLNERIIRRRVNFYDLFRGEHAIVSIGGKEVENARRVS